MSRSLRRVLSLAMGSLTALAAGPALASADVSPQQKALNDINHIVVIYEENHSFDNLYGGWEGVNGLAGADAAHTTQIGQDGSAYSCLLQNHVNLTVPPLAPTCRPTSHFANQPFGVDANIPASTKTCPQPGSIFPPASNPN